MRFHGFTETEYDVTSEFSTKITEITGFLLSQLTELKTARRHLKKRRPVKGHVIQIDQSDLDWRQTDAGRLSDSGGVIWGRSEQPDQLTL